MVSSLADLEPAEKNVSSSSSLDVLDDVPRDLDFGGGVRRTSSPSLGALDIVTGEPSPRTTPAARPNPKPSPGLAFRARLTAEANSASKSVSELVLRIELLLLGAMTRGSPG